MSDQDDFDQVVRERDSLAAQLDEALSRESWEQAEAALGAGGSPALSEPERQTKTGDLVGDGPCTAMDVRGPGSRRSSGSLSAGGSPTNTEQADEALERLDREGGGRLVRSEKALWADIRSVIAELYRLRDALSAARAERDDPESVHPMMTGVICSWCHCRPEEAKEWLTPFDGSGIEWHENLPSPYTYKPSDFHALVAAVHEYEARAEAAEREVEAVRRLLSSMDEHGDPWRLLSEITEALAGSGAREPAAQPATEAEDGERGL